MASSSVEKKPSAYDQHRERSRQRQADIARAGMDIGDIPPVFDVDRRGRGEGDLEYFCLAYYPQTFALPFSTDHRKVIRKAQQAVLFGGLFALAMPRGSGKTSLCEVICQWALLYGHRGFLCLIGASESKADDMMTSIKAELETNDMLYEDFPEVCHAVRALEGIANRCKGQRYQGERTRIVWTAGKIVLPSIPGSRASGAAAVTVGITGSVRGLKHKRADGASVRPDLVIIDDPQTDESAASATQCATRLRTLSGAVLGLAGPGKKISGLMPCTVIRPGDVADKLLDANGYPQWNGERTRMVYAWPERADLWERYAEIRSESLRAGNRGAEASEFYRANRAEMDRGAVVAWPERFNLDELSAVQHAWNLRLDLGDEAFGAEYQNDPAPLMPVAAGDLSSSEIASRLNRLRRGTPPRGTSTLTAFIDVQGSLLFYCVAGWEADFTGAVVEYGTWPRQQRAYFSLREARPTLAEATGVGSVEGSVRAGLVAVADLLLGREWASEGSEPLRVHRCLIDAAWGQSTEVVRQFCRSSVHAAILTPSMGRGIGAAGSPMDAWPKKTGERRGINWLLPAARAGQGRTLLYDANWWKTFVAARLGQPEGERGALVLYGEKATQHRLFAEHCTAEYRVRTQGRGREVDEWKIRPEKPDNHWWDCLVGCAVAASFQGVALPLLAGGVERTKGGRKRVSFAEMQRRAKGR